MNKFLFDKSKFKIKSPINYMGAKYQLLSKLLPLFPKNKKYFIDMFTGGGSIYMNVNHLYDKVYANDLLSPIIDIHVNLHDNNYIELAKEASLPVIDSQEYYNELKSLYNKTKKSHLLLALIWSCNSNMMRFNRNLEFNQSWGNRGYNDNTKKIISEFNCKDFTNVIFSSLHFEQLKSDVSKEELKKNYFIYLDPPYSNTEAGYNTLWDADKALIKLLAFYINNDIKFGISGVLNDKPNKIYDFLNDKKVKIMKFGDLYQVIAKKEKINNEYYITNVT